MNSQLCWAEPQFDGVISIVNMLYYIFSPQQRMGFLPVMYNMVDATHSNDSFV